MFNTAGKQTVSSFLATRLYLTVHFKWPSFKMAVLIHYTNEKPQPISKDSWHPVEAIGTAKRSLRNLDSQWKPIEKRVTSKQIWMVCPRGFTCQISSVILTDMIQTVLETSVFSIPVFSIPSVFYFYLLIICISYLLGMSSRQLNLGMHFIRTWKYCPLSPRS